MRFLNELIQRKRAEHGGTQFGESISTQQVFPTEPNESKPAEASPYHLKLAEDFDRFASNSASDRSHEQVAAAENADDEAWDDHMQPTGESPPQSSYWNGFEAPVDDFRIRKLGAREEPEEPVETAPPMEEDDSPEAEAAEYVADDSEVVAVSGTEADWSLEEEVEAVDDLLEHMIEDEGLETEPFDQTEDLAESDADALKAHDGTSEEQDSADFADVEFAARASSTGAPDAPSPSAKVHIWDLDGDDETDEATGMAEAASAYEPARLADHKPSHSAEGSSQQRRAGRVRTRLLGFHRPEELEADPFERAQGKAIGGAPAQQQFPVGWLVVEKGPGRGASFALGDGVSKIGRGEDQTVRLDFGDTSVSRDGHAVIAYDNEQRRFFVGHSGKANLVRLNGMPVLSTETFRNGDSLRIGETTLRFVALCGPDFDWDDTSDIGGLDVAAG